MSVYSVHVYIADLASKSLSFEIYGFTNIVLQTIGWGAPT